jgi:hypothetical protein
MVTWIEAWDELNPPKGGVATANGPPKKWKGSNGITFACSCGLSYWKEILFWLVLMDWGRFAVIRKVVTSLENCLWWF